jgi:2'-hydroxyisoflavone reductase
MKALCEQYTREIFKGRACIVRPGYIVGPGDPTDRFTYWPVRASKGGEMLAPGTPQDAVQVIDVRDLAAFLMRLASKRTVGTFNAVSPPRSFTMGQLIAACQEASQASGTRLTWVPESFLEKHWKPDDMDLPPWAPSHGDTAGLALISAARAQAAGLTVRPLAETVRDTLAWFKSLPPERQAKLQAGLDPAKEAETLRQWHTSGANP